MQVVGSPTRGTPCGPPGRRPDAPLGEADSATARRIIGLLVLQVLLPALVFRVVVQVQSGDELWRIPLTMLLGTLATLGLAIALFSRIPLAHAEKGALVLASSFGNVTGLTFTALNFGSTAFAFTISKRI